jgi:anti-anti-sigma regulatory factor
MLAIAPGCELDVERGPDWLLVRVRNLASAESEATPLADRVWSLLQQHFTYRLVLELDDAGLLNSPLIGQLIQLYRRIEGRDGVMRVCSLSPHNRQVLHTCRLDERLLPYTDRREAVMGSADPRQPR